METGHASAVGGVPVSAQKERPTTEIDSLPADYDQLLRELKERVAGARATARRTVNAQLVELYWEIGRAILDRQARQGWGTKVIARLASDLRREFPGMRGLSATNLQYMRGFAAAWASGPAVSQQPVGKLPWGHIIVLLDKLDDPAIRDVYAAAAVEFGWSRNVPTNQILNRSLERAGTAASNFAARLAPPDSELAQQIAKDPTCSISSTSPARSPNATSRTR